MIVERDWVIHSKTGNCGQVLEISNGIAYIELENGVEMDFPVAELVLESEYKTPADIEQEQMDAADEDKKAAAEIIWPKIRPVLAHLTQLYMEHMAVAVTAIGGSSSPWDELTAYHKMNFLCIWTKIPFEKWVDAKDVGMLDKLQLTIMGKIGEEAIKK